MENQQKHDSSLVNWTKKEKFLLLEGLKMYKPFKVSLLSDSLTSKSEKEINDAIQMYRKKRLLSSSLKQKGVQKRHRNEQPSTVLDSWANLLKNSYGLENLQNETASAFRLIGYFESKPPPACTGNIDFKKVYLMMADAIEGKPIPNDKYFKYILNRCVKETASTTKVLIKTPKYREMIKSLNVSDPEMISFVKPTANMELVTLRRILKEKSYNPFFLSEDCLIPSAQP